MWQGKGRARVLASQAGLRHLLARAKKTTIEKVWLDDQTVASKSGASTYNWLERGAKGSGSGIERISWTLTLIVRVACGVSSALELLLSRLFFNLSRANGFVRSVDRDCLEVVDRLWKFLFFSASSFCWREMRTGDFVFLCA